MDSYRNIPLHIKLWMATPEGWQRVSTIVLDALDDVTNVVTNVEIREIVEEAYRRAHTAATRPVPSFCAYFTCLQTEGLAPRTLSDGTTVQVCSKHIDVPEWGETDG